MKSGLRYNHDSYHIPVTSFYDSKFFGIIEIGNPSQAFEVIFDTTFSGIWVPSIKCKSSFCFGRNKFNGSSSETYFETNDDFQINYGSAVVKGKVSKDVITLGGLKILEQEFGEGNKIFGSDFKDAPFDGVFGLGFENIATSEMIPPLKNIFSDQKLPKQIVSLWLNRNDEGPSGELIFGGVDRSKFYGNVTFVPLVRKGFWEITLHNLLIKSEKLGIKRNLVIASGNSLNIIPEEDSYRIHKKLKLSKNSSGFYDVPCGEKDNLSNIILKIGPMNITLTPDDYIVRLNDKCISTFVGQNIESPTGPLWIMGSIFLESYYTVFDFERNRVGFAKSK